MSQGPRPNFFESDLLLALRLISQKEVGRHRLAEELYLGEASVRSLLTRLKKSGLISSTSSGHSITTSGRRLLEKMITFTMPEEIDAGEIVIEEKSMAFLLHGVSEKISDGLAQRDRAIIGGATGATTLIFERGTFKFPKSEESLGRKLNGALKERFKPRPRDVLVIVSAPTKGGAFRGCASVLEGFL